MRTEIGAQMETPRKGWRAMFFSSAFTKEEESDDDDDDDERIESNKSAAAAAVAATRSSTRSRTIVFLREYRPRPHAWKERRGKSRGL